MNVILDGVALEGANGVERLNTLKARLKAGHRIPARLKVDGYEAGLERLNGLNDSDSTVELETRTLSEVAANAYAEAEDYLPRLEAAVERCSDILVVGKIREAMDTIAGVCRGVSWLFGLLEPLDALVGRSAAAGWSAEAEELKPLLLATEDAIAQQDWILVSDQLRYEWAPRLRGWKESLSRAGAETAQLAAKAGR